MSALLDSPPELPVMTMAQFHAALGAQGVPREHVAVKCPVCETVQSFADLKNARAAADPKVLSAYFGKLVEPEDNFAHSCIGRYTEAGPWTRDKAPGSGCNWTLSGFLQAHRLLIQADDGKRFPAFEPATPKEAQEHFARAAIAKATGSTAHG